MENNIIIISGPSGAGEDSIINELSKRLEIERVITTTTRQVRPEESDGSPYYFISKEEFLKKIEDGDFFEYAKQYNDNYYGVTLDEIKRVQESGKVGIWKIDYKGTQSAKKSIPEIVSIFITAPLGVMEDRIRRRQFVTEEYIMDRMAYTKEWMDHKDIYDYEVVNEEDKLMEAVDKVEAIIRQSLGLDKNQKQ